MAQATVNINLKELNYTNFASQVIYFRLLNAGAEDGGDYIVARGRKSVTTDANGDASISLFVNGDSGIDSVYEVELPGNERIKFIIPTGAGPHELANLLVNNQPDGTTGQQNTTYNEAIKRTNHTGGPDDLNGNEIILDVDGDTSITADTDDQIDVKIGGTDEYVFKASSFDINGNELILDADGDTSITSDTDDRIDFRFGGVDELTLTATKADNLDDISALTPTDSNFIVGDGTNWVAESGETAQISLGILFGATSVKLGQSASVSALNAIAIGRNSSVSAASSAQIGAGTNSTASTIQFLSSGSVTATQFGKLAATTTSVTATSYTTLATDKFVLVDDDTAGSAVTVTLLAAATAGDGAEINIKKLGSTASVIVDGNGAETIDGATTATLTIQYESIRLVCDGSNWHII